MLTPDLTWRLQGVGLTLMVVAGVCLLITAVGKVGQR